jgi:urease accessory protein
MEAKIPAMNNRHVRHLALAALCILAPTAALAHPGHDGASAAFLAGLMHPLSGLDHVLMIVAVSAWAALLPWRQRCMVAACLGIFVGVGALLPFAPSPGPALEVAIAWATGPLAAAFALIHGFAHGAEGPAGSALYVPGLAVATSVLALCVSLLAARLQPAPAWLRAGGVVTAAFGAAAILG